MHIIQRYQHVGLVREIGIGRQHAAGPNIAEQDTRPVEVEAHQGRRADADCGADRGGLAEPVIGHDGYAARTGVAVGGRKQQIRAVRLYCGRAALHAGDAESLTVAIRIDGELRQVDQNAQAHMRHDSGWRGGRGRWPVGRHAVIGTDQLHVGGRNPAISVHIRRRRTGQRQRAIRAIHHAVLVHVARERQRKCVRPRRPADRQAEQVGRTDGE